MDAKIVGPKIKEARLSKKMTQAEVVGTFITRNMLSQIESGTAMPSMKTLAYLSTVLDLPLSSLLNEETGTLEPPQTLVDSSPYGQLSTLKSLAAKQDFRGIMSILSASSLSSEDDIYDEKAAYFARASYECALLCEAEKDLSGAIAYAKNAEYYASAGFYANPKLKADALLLLARLAEELGRQYR